MAVEALLDADGRVKRGKCRCSYFHRFALKNGPCRHLLALRTAALTGSPDASGGGGPAAWYDRFRQGNPN